MKKSNIIILVLVLILVSISAVVYFGGDNKSTLKELKDFAIEDTASVTKIFLVDKANNEITLERVDNGWVVNKDFEARKDFMKIMLETLKDVDIYKPVLNSAKQTVLRNMSASSTKVEIYQNNKLSKTYYVGGTTQSQTGTYMLLENSSRPFVMHIPGFNGFLSVRYNTDLYEWRERIIYKSEFKDIKSIAIEYPSDMENSHKLINLGNNEYRLETLKDQKEVKEYDRMKVKETIARFKFIAFESYMNDKIAKERRDSTLATTPDAIYTIEKQNGEITNFKTYKRPNINEQFSEKGEIFNTDIFRKYAFINNDRDMVMVQYANLDVFTLKLDDFKKDK